MIKDGEVDKDNFPPFTSECPCGHPHIVVQCYIQNVVTSAILVVGSTCTKRFMGLEMIEQYWKNKWKRKNRIETWGKHTVSFGKH